MLSAEMKSCLELLVALAWADGKVTEEEQTIVESVLDVFGPSEEEAKAMLEWAATPRTLDDVDVSKLSRSDAELVLQHAVLLTFIDGEQSPSEVELLDKIVGKLELPADVAGQIIEVASARARELIPVLSE